MTINSSTIKKVLIRVDYNVPIQNNQILDLTRIKASIPTINYFLKQETKIILMSHLGRPNGIQKQFSLKKLVPIIESLLGLDVFFVPEITNKTNSLIDSSAHRVILLENLRFYIEEKTNDLKFSKILSSLGHIYVNDAFGVSHRNHASVSSITKFFKNKKYKGFLLESEIKTLKNLKEAPKHPYTIVVGGSKIGSKIHILKSFLNIADNILIGGGMAFPFIKYNGGHIGRSICSESELSVVESFLKQANKSNTKINLPIDCIVTDDITQKTNQRAVDIRLIPEGYFGVDIGPKTVQFFCRRIKGSKLIVWNGPMGISEIQEFSNGSKKISESIIKETKKGAYSVIGGGDTISDISRFGLKNQFSYISTGGGAMLEFFKNEDLPGTKGLRSIQ